LKLAVVADDVGEALLSGTKAHRCAQHLQDNCWHLNSQMAKPEQKAASI
jgi:hypothetical protein